MILPPFLKPGDKIGITCPAGYVTEERISYAVKSFEEWGYGVVKGTTVGDRELYMSGTDEERRADLQRMLDDATINAIVMGRGGYGVSRIIDALDFAKFMEAPKWICGFSDITVLHNHIHRHCGVATMHSPMCGAIKADTEQSAYIQSFKSLLAGDYMIPATGANPWNRAGAASGILTGGNLSLLVHLAGSDSEVAWEGKILFIEDIGEYRYNIDRMMLHLKRSGKLAGLAGLVVGDFNDLQDTPHPFGMDYREIIAEKVAAYSYPVCFDFPAGHMDVNYPFVLGMNHELTVGRDGAQLKMS